MPVVNRYLLWQHQNAQSEINHLRDLIDHLDAIGDQQRKEVRLDYLKHLYDSLNGLRVASNEACKIVMDLINEIEDEIDAERQRETGAG